MGEPGEGAVGERDQGVPAHPGVVLDAHEIEGAVAGIGRRAHDGAVVPRSDDVADGRVGRVAPETHALAVVVGNHGRVTSGQPRVQPAARAVAAAGPRPPRRLDLPSRRPSLSGCPNVCMMTRLSPTEAPTRDRPRPGQSAPEHARDEPDRQPAAVTGDGPLSRRLVLLLAVACGAAVANLYYAQPLLHTISAGLGVSASGTALLVTASQIGYAAGLVLIVPLGDLVNRRRLITGMLVVTSIGLAGAALAPSLAVLAIALVVVGTTSVVAQILVPFASGLAGEDERGRVVGIVMSGLLIGILLARTFSGLAAELGGWRLVYGIAAGGGLVLAVALARALPDVRPAAGPSYGRLLASVGTLIAEEPLLRRRMVYGALGMAGFTVVWTALALLLSGPPFSFGAAVIGLFGLAGLAGAMAAQVAGRAADAGGGRRATGAFLGAILIGWGFLALGRSSVVGLIAGLVVLDLGVQGQHILNQTLIYAVRPEARSRLTTAYMSGNFIAAAIASAAAVSAWELGGWLGVCGLGAALAVSGVVAWIVEGHAGAGRARSRREPVAGRGRRRAGTRGE